MQAKDRLRALSALVATATLAAACGGGSDSPPPPPPPPPPPSSFDISGWAVDGALQGATACLDTNDNKACDSGEPTSAVTTANGGFTITVANAAQAGAHRIIVNVPATAIDADTGQAVGAAFTLVAPATGVSGTQSVFVSPLTTLVAQQMDASGQTRAQAADYVQQQAGLTVSPLADFTSPANAKAANVAKLVVQTTLQQRTAVSTAVGQTDVSGAAITAAELERAVNEKVIAALPVIGAAAVDPAVVNLTGTAREQALATSAATVVAGIGFTPEQARFVVGLPKIPQPPNAAPAAGANMVALQYTDGANWFFRYNAATAADNTPDANGLQRYYSVRTRMAPYAFDPGQGVAESFARTTNTELHWSGSAWTACTVTDRSNQTQRDAQGRSSYDFCRNNEKGVSQRGEIDIGGQAMADVWTNKLLVEQAKTTNPNAWSLPSTALLGNAVFPVGSRLALQTNTITETAITYNTATSNRVDVAPLAVAQGGDARGSSPACATDASRELLGTLETLVARNLGQPCVFNQQTNDANGPSLTPNEVWGTSTVSMGTLATNVERPAGTANYYTTTRLLRVSFPSAGNTVYWSCLQRTTNNASRNCTQIGTGTYAIATLGDARVMTFANLPASAQALASTRVFVERGGAVYFGFKPRVGTQSTTVRLNMTAANALLRQLDMPTIEPVDAPHALPGAKATNAQTMQGVWYFSDQVGSGVLRVGADGQFLSASTDPPSGSQRPGLEYGWLDVDAGGKLGRLVEIDSNGSNDYSHFDPAAVFAITDTQFSVTVGGTTESYDGRLPDNGTGIVGMWALGSATDLKVTHFVFFGNGKVLSLHPAETSGPCAAARQGPPGIEWSDYSFNEATGVLTFSNKTIDTSGCTGIWDSTDANQPASVSITIALAADKRTFTAVVDGGATTLTFYRVTPNP